MTSAYERYVAERWTLTPEENKARWPRGPVTPDNYRGVVPIGQHRLILSPEGESTGFCEAADNRSLRDVWTELRAKLEETDLLREAESFSPWTYEGLSLDEPFPAYRELACFCVAGSNEGHYVHVEALGGAVGDHAAHNRRRLVFLGKTFMGAAHGWALAAKVAELLGAT